MRTLSYLCGAVALALAGCAKAPTTITPSYVSTLEYRDASCHDLHMEARNLDLALKTEFAEQRGERTRDVLGLLLLGSTVSTSSGGNRAHQIAETKGRALAVRDALDARGCGVGTGSVQAYL